MTAREVWLRNARQFEDEIDAARGFWRWGIIMGTQLLDYSESALYCYLMAEATNDA